MGESCMRLHLPKWHMHLGATCTSEENPLMVNLSDRTKFHSLKYERGRKKIFCLDKSEAEKKSKELTGWRNLYQAK